MNCHNKNGKKGHGMLMLLCCLIPLMLVFMLPRLGVNIGPLARIAPFAMLLICPLMHIGMFVFMFKGKDKNCHGANPAERADA